MSLFVKPRLFVFFLSIVHFTQGFAVNGLTVIILTTLEKRFHLPSYKLGIIASSYDIGFASCCLVLPYFLKKYNRPKIISLGTVAMAIGCGIFILPHFIGGRYTYPLRTDELCYTDDSSHNSTTHVKESSNEISMFLFVLGGVVMGIANIPAFTLGFTYIEDNITQNKSSLNIAIVNSMEIFGVICGILVGSKFLTFPTDIGSTHSDITVRDRRWVGAWWPGFSISAVLVVLCAGLPLLSYPHSFVRKQDMMLEKEQKSKVNQRILFFRDFVSFLRNKIALVVILAASLEMCVIIPLASFLPKLFQMQYNISTTYASMMTGLVAMPATIFGHVFAGFLARKYKMTIRQLALFCTITSTVALVIGPAIFAFSCDQSSEIIMLRQRNGTGITGAPMSPLCNRNCHCKAELYYPVCGNDGNSYFSPCYAGCQSYDKENMTYTNCTCVNSANPHAASDICEKSCDLLYPFAIYLFFVTFIVFMCYTPTMLMILRVVSKDLREIALGTKTIMIRFCVVPGSIFLGYLLDKSCIMWQGDTTNKGMCGMYDNKQSLINTALFVVPLKFISTMLYFIGYRLCRNLPVPDLDIKG